MNALCKACKFSVSAATDNCFRYVAVVYCRSLSKGITVERRRRKASGPKAQVVRRIAGLPAEASLEAPLSSLPVHSACFRQLSASFAKQPHSGRAREQFARVIHESHKEQRKLKRANSSKGGDAKPPVYGTQVLRQRGCRTSRTKLSVPCVTDQVLRLMHRVRSSTCWNVPNAERNVNVIARLPAHQRSDVAAAQRSARQRSRQ
jgi:hypothetical protein